MNVDRSSQQPWLKRHGATVGVIAVIFYVPLAALLALINPTLGWVVAVVGAGAATVVFGIPMFMAMLPGLLIWCGGALALGGLLGLQGPGSILLGALLAVAGYIWSRAQKQ